MNQHAARLLTLATLALLPACGLPDAPDAHDAETPVAASRSSALCTDGAPDATVAFRNHGGLLTADSPLSSDQYDRSDCDDRFVTQVDGTLGGELAISGDWAGGTWNLPEITCSFAFASVRSYGHRPRRCRIGAVCTGGDWVSLGPDVLLHGRYYALGAPFTGGYCVMEPTEPGQQLPSFTSSPYDSVRVGVRAFWFGFGGGYVPARAGVYSREIIR